MKGLEKHIVVFAFIFLGTWLQASSQDGNPLQYLSGVSQSAISNPAFQNKTEKLVVGLPIVSGAWMDWNANFALDYIFSKHFAYSFDKFYNELGEPGNELATITIPVLYLSLRQENQNFTLSVTERILTQSSFDHNFLKFIDNGLLPYYGKTEEYGPMNIHAYHYRELAFAYSKQLWEGFTIGIRPKVLFGRINYDMSNMYIRVLTDADASQLLVQPQGNYKIAGALEVTYIPEKNATSIKPNPGFSDYFFNFRNLGAAVDFGFEYKTGKTEFSAAINDLGFFTMNHSVYDVSYSDALRYDEEDLYQSTNPDGDNYIEPRFALQQLIDSLPFVVTAQPANENLTENIPLKLNAMVRHHFSKRTDAGISTQLTFYNGTSKSYLSSFGYTILNDHFDLAASLALIDLKKLLPGVGASYTAKNVQIYLSTNNITALFWPSSAKYINLCFGVNFLFSTR